MDLKNVLSQSKSNRAALSPKIFLNVRKSMNGCDRIMNFEENPGKEKYISEIKYLIKPF